MKISTFEEKHGIHWTVQNQLDDLDFTDHLTILANTHQQMLMETTSVAAASASVDLNIHKGNSKILKYNTQNTNTVTLDGEPLNEMETYTYMDSIVDQCGGCDADVNVKVDKARTTFLHWKNMRLK
ncbi:unnamed protein product [Schistosoma margrebowiei]|uniref:Uncharacterized protein n=1 Tax=Schistosoma margrebowiei TaxID=48269 RepID=A0A183N103_9TREM|nr:unnamed protein product [Schistosoma margrebowiei]